MLILKSVFNFQMVVIISGFASSAHSCVEHNAALGPGQRLPCAVLTLWKFEESNSKAVPQGWQLQLHSEVAPYTCHTNSPEICREFYCKCNINQRQRDH